MIHSKLQKRIEPLIQWLKNNKTIRWATPVVIGFVATIWFLIRVIPKPSRAGYPCMQASYPFMTGFVVWLFSLTGVFTSVKFIKSNVKKRKYAYASIGVIALVIALGITTKQSATKMYAKITAESIVHPENVPMGSGVGILPGSVAWAWDPDATDENCTNTMFDSSRGPDGFFLAKNNNQIVIDHMLHKTIIAIGNGVNTNSSMDSIFTYFNKRKGKGNVNYVAGEKVFLKINQGGGGWLTNGDDLSFNGAGWREVYYGMAETSPAIVLSMLDILVNTCGVLEEDILVGDPIAHIYKHNYDQMVDKFPDVKYIDKTHSDLGRTLLTVSDDTTIFYSDNGAVMTEAIGDKLYTEMEKADYLINIAALKAHARNGFTLTTKNHFGSHARNSAAHLHPSLVAPENDIVERGEYGKYRALVDIMGSSKLGGNTMLFIVDGLWGGTEANDTPVKWEMAPFNGDWPNSIFASQDQVALESVCFDFLRSEVVTTGSSDKWQNRPLMAQGVDDHLHQAADSANWPVGITYDPDRSGKPFASLGTHEHWNNDIDKEYSQNLGVSSGILLIPLLAKENKDDFYAHNTGATKPVFDGVADEALWQNVTWQYIDQFWMPYGDILMPDDFSGRFKVMWSDIDNKLYVLAETIDDVFIDGYKFPDGDYPDYDVLEIFIDADKSGGKHAGIDGFNGGSVEDAENAFSLHIAIDRPEDGDTTTVKVGADLKGPNWSDIANYADHLTDFIVKRDGNKLTWEFSIDVYNDTYDSSKDAMGNASSLVTLTEGKAMGFAVAYCDNDTLGTKRDNFIGSDWGPNNGGEFNDYWKVCDNYAALMLKSSTVTTNRVPGFLQDDYSVSISEVDTSISIVGDLRTIALDLDADNLFFSAISGSGEIAVSIVNYELLLTATSDFNSTAQVFVTTYDGRGGVAQTRINVIYNRAPEFTKEIEDIDIRVLNQKYTVVEDLNSICTDPDGNVITYSVKTDNAEIEAVIDGTTLNILAFDNFISVANITVTATDIHGNAGKTTFVAAYGSGPRFIEMIPNAEILVLGEDVTIVDDLDTKCMGVDLVYTVSSDDVNLSAKIEGKKLSINGGADFSEKSIVTVIATDDMNQTDSTKFNVTYTPSTDIDTKIDGFNELKVYPNPTQGESVLNITSINSNEVVKIRVYNLQGEIVMHKEVVVHSSEFNYSLNLQNQPDGNYIIKVVNGNKMETVRVQKIK